MRRSTYILIALWLLMFLIALAYVIGEVWKVVTS